MDPHACAVSGSTSNNPRSASCAHRSPANWHRLIRGRWPKIHKQTNDNIILRIWLWFQKNPQYSVSLKMHTNLRMAVEDACVQGKGCFSWNLPNADIVLLLFAGIKDVCNSRNLVAPSSSSPSPWLPADICRQRCCSWRCSSSASAPLMRIRRRAPSFLPKVGGFAHYSDMYQEILGSV